MFHKYSIEYLSLGSLLLGLFSSWSLLKEKARCKCLFFIEKNTQFWREVLCKASDWSPLHWPESSQSLLSSAASRLSSLQQLQMLLLQMLQTFYSIFSDGLKCRWKHYDLTLCCCWLYRCDLSFFAWKSIFMNKIYENTYLVLIVLKSILYFT